MSHDNRKKSWNISMSEEEFAAADEKRKLAGMHRAEYSRKALCSAQIISKINCEDRKLAADLIRLHTSVNEMAKVVLAIKKKDLPNSNELIVRYLYKQQDELSAISDATADIANYFTKKA